jgi:serine/threonine protein kinase
MDDLDFDQTIRGFAAGQKVFGRYTVKKVLGRGGMGVVWLAFDEKLEREVALKFLPELLVLDAASLDDLKRETKRNLELTHQNIVRVYDFAQEGNCAGISMEYVDGPTLSSLRVDRENKVLEITELEPIVQQACAALEYAHHTAGIVHRDLKPANLMMNSRGQLKITDFGIARSLSDSISMLTMKKTSGTLVYMSPQQLDGEHASPLDDVYSLGATIYELLASKPPFYSGGVDKQIHEKTPPPMAQRRKELGVVSDKPIPAHWEETVAACLSKDPAARPQTMREIPQRLSGAPPVPVSRQTGVSIASGKTAAPSRESIVPPMPPLPKGGLSRFPAVQWWQVAAVIVVAAGVLGVGILALLGTNLFNSKPGEQWARSVLDQQLNASLDTPRSVRFTPKQIAIRSAGSGVASVDVTGSATATEPLYLSATPDDPALQTKLAKLQDADQQVAALRDYAGVEIARLDPNEFVFVKETTPQGQNASFYLQFEAERSGRQWKVKRTTAAELSPKNVLIGKPIATFGSGAAILGTDKARKAEAELSHRIDAYLARIAEAQKHAARRFALAGRDPSGNLLFPPDRAAPGEKFPQTRMRALSADELQQFSDDELQYAINEVYARHGGAFDKKIRSTFRKFPWYQPQSDASAPEVEASLSAIEAQNVKMLGLVRSAKQEEVAQKRRSRPRSRGSEEGSQEHGNALEKAGKAADIFSKVAPFLHRP